MTVIFDRKTEYEVPDNGKQFIGRKDFYLIKKGEFSCVIDQFDHDCTDENKRNNMKRKGLIEWSYI